MDRGCVRQPRSRFRHTILMTIAGLAMTAMFPAVRSAPGLSSTPRRAEIPTGLVFVPAESEESDLDQVDSGSPLKIEQEGDAGDSEAAAEELLPADWDAIRSARGRSSDRGRAPRVVATSERLAAPGSGRPIRRVAFATDAPHVGLPVRLCRLLF